MKLTTALCTLTLATAQDGSQDANSQGKQDDSDQAQSYGNEGYAEQSYGEAAPMSYGFRAPELCLGACPKEAPCQHRATGACVPKMGGETYEGQSYGAQQFYGGEQQQGYRRLEESDNSYGYEAPATQDAAPVQSYAAPVQTYEPPSEGCPYGTVDTSCGSLNSHIVLWVAFALLFLPALWFFCNAFAETIVDSATGLPVGEDATTAPSILKYRVHRVIAGVICFIASLAYLAMATGHGYTVRCCDGRQFYYARYVDWAITTPLLLWEIIDYTAAPINQRFFMYAADVLMIIAGLIGSIVCGGEKWIFFGFAMLCFIPILWFLCAIRDVVDFENKTAFESLMNITVISWFFYPIIWILAEGTGTLCASAEAICYTVLDIISKSAFGFVVINHPFQIMTEGSTTDLGSSAL